MARVLRMAIIVSIAILLVNVVVLSNHSSLETDTASEASNFIPPDFFGTFSRRVGGGEDDYPPEEYPEKDSHANNNDPTNPHDLSAAAPKPNNEGRLRPSRILVGIFSSDSSNDRVYRKRHRQLFELWNDTRVCSLPEFEATQNPNCQLIWTFIMGGNNHDPNAPTEIVNASYPILATKPIQTKQADINRPDVSLLNIRYVQHKNQFPTVEPIVLLGPGLAIYLVNRPRYVIQANTLLPSLAFYRYTITMIFK